MSSRSSFVNVLVSILCIMFLVVIISNLFRFTTGNVQYLTFEGLLQMLQNSSSFQSYAPFIDLKIYGSWGVFDFLRTFINSTTGLLTFGLWFVENIMNAVVFAMSFIYQLFWIV